MAAGFLSASGAVETPGDCKVRTAGTLCSVVDLRRADGGPRMLIEAALLGNADAEPVPGAALDLLGFKVDDRLGACAVVRDGGVETARSGHDPRAGRRGKDAVDAVGAAGCLD